MINYAAIGSEIEHNYDSAQCAAFARKYHQSTDGAMASLATFARFVCTAKCERLAGRIDVAQLAELNAQTVYEREIKPANRW